jgi:hypothetical protein
MADLQQLQQRISELEAQVDSSRADRHDLTTMGAVIASLRDPDAVLSVALEMAIRRVKGDVGAILLNSSRGLRPAAVMGLDMSIIDLLLSGRHKLTETAFQ